MSASGTPLRVGINAALDPLAAGGVQTNLVALVDALPSQLTDVLPTLLVPTSVDTNWRRRARDPFEVAHWPFPLAWYRESGARPWYTRLRERWIGSAKRRARAHDRHLRSLGIDVVHFPYQLAFDTTLPFVYEPWDFQHVHLPQFFSAGERAWRDDLYGRACRNARYVVTATAASKRDVINLFGVAPERVAVIYRDSTMVREKPSREACKDVAHRLGLPTAFALYPAQAYPHKNHLRLFEAIARLRDQGTEIAVACTGRDTATQSPRLREAVNSMGLDALIRFLGPVSEAELTALYRSARLLVFPSLFEGLGLPLLEAMYHDLPIAAARVSCIPEVVGSAGLLFDPMDPADIAATLRRLWETPALSEELINNARLRLDTFDWQTAARTFDAVYRRAGNRQLDADADALLRRALAC